MITFEEFLGVCKETVMFWPSSPAWGRLNTFSYLDKGSDIAESALGRSFDDYQEGFFWARDWVLSGASPSRMEKEYGILAVESKEVNVDPDFTNQVVRPVTINILILRDCEECKTNYRPVMEVQEEVVKAFRTLLERFNGVFEFEVQPVTGGPYKTWMTTTQAQYYLANRPGEITSISQMGDSLMSYIQPERGNWQVFPTNWQLGDNVIGAAMNITISTCDPVNPVWDHDISPGDALGVVKCC